MTVQVEFWQLLTFMIGLLLAFLSFAFVAGRMLLAQVDQRLAQRFEAMESAREQASKHWDERFGAAIEQNRREAEGWSALERDFLRFQADLPLQYVRREDYVRGQTVIEAKLDALYNKLEVVQMKGATHG
jgi:Ni/Co efflux regulator RcnB